VVCITSGEKMASKVKYRLDRYNCNGVYNGSIFFNELTTAERHLKAHNNLIHYENNLMYTSKNYGVIFPMEKHESMTPYENINVFV